MTTVLNRRVMKDRLGRAAACGLLAFAAALCSASEARAQWVTSGANTTTTNNVGIGITTPSQMFHVHSSGAWAGTRVTTASTGTTINDGVHFGYDDGYGAYVWNREATPVILSTSNTERMRIAANGNVGLGVTAPASRLHVRDTDATADNEMLVETTAGNYGPTLRLKSSIAGQTADFLLTATASANAGGAGAFRIYDYAANATRLFIAPATGHVGIGTTAPTNPFDLRAAANRVARFTSTGNAHMGVQIDAAPGYNSNLVLMSGGVEKWYLGNRAGDERFSLYEATGTREVFAITQAGRVGIGITAPATALHVVGDVTVTGNLSAKYQDVAEWVPSTQALAAGTVVALDTSRPNHVVASATPYDTRVAGVVSAQPGIALGERGEGKVLVATTGRVRMKVNAAHAPIRIGDLLVTSDVPGVAMRSEPLTVGGRQLHAPGTIIGKALESLEKGTGEILVLLSLQ